MHCLRCNYTKKHVIIFLIHDVSVFLNYSILSIIVLHSLRDRSGPPWRLLKSVISGMGERFLGATTYGKNIIQIYIT